MTYTDFDNFFRTSYIFSLFILFIFSLGLSSSIMMIIKRRFINFMGVWLETGRDAVISGIMVFAISLVMIIVFGREFLEINPDMSQRIIAGFVFTVGLLAGPIYSELEYLIGVKMGFLDKYQQNYNTFRFIRLIIAIPLLIILALIPIVLYLSRAQ